MERECGLDQTVTTQVGRGAERSREETRGGDDDGGGGGGGGYKKDSKSSEAGKDVDEVDAKNR